MDILGWIVIGVIISGFIVLFSLKKRMEGAVATMNQSPEEDHSAHARAVIYWVTSAAIWSIISIGLIVLLFYLYT